jgi:hypothetical protein
VGESCLVPRDRALGDAEVEHVRLAVRVHQDVRGLEVAVDDPVLVRVQDRVAHLDHRPKPRAQDRAARPVEGAGPAVDPLPVDELHGDRVAAVAHRARVVDGHDAGVMEGGRDLRFALEALTLTRRREGAREEHLDRYFAPGLDLFAAVDDALAAAVEFLEDAVSGEVARPGLGGLDRRPEPPQKTVVLADLGDDRGARRATRDVVPDLPRALAPSGCF